MHVRGGLRGLLLHPDLLDPLDRPPRIDHRSLLHSVLCVRVSVVGSSRSEEPPNITTCARSRLDRQQQPQVSLSLVFTSTALSSKPHPSHSQSNVVIDDGLTHSLTSSTRRSTQCRASQSLTGAQVHTERKRSTPHAIRWSWISITQKGVDKRYSEGVSAHGMVALMVSGVSMRVRERASDIERERGTSVACWRRCCCIIAFDHFNGPSLYSLSLSLSLSRS